MKKTLMTLLVMGFVSGWTVQSLADDAAPMEGQGQIEEQKAEQNWEAKHAAMKEKMEKMKADCQADVQKFCASAKGHERMHCLIQNKPQLSSTCQADVTKMQEFHKKHAEMMKGAPATSTN